MEIKELEKLIENVYVVVGEKYLKYFRCIIGGCHCYPATEWYGDIYLAFKKVLTDNVIKEKNIKEEIDVVVEQLSEWFTK